MGWGASMGLGQGFAKLGDIFGPELAEAQARRKDQALKAQQAAQAMKASEESILASRQARELAGKQEGRASAQHAAWQSDEERDELMRVLSIYGEQPVPPEVVAKYANRPGIFTPKGQVNLTYFHGPEVVARLDDLRRAGRNKDLEYESLKHELDLAKQFGHKDRALALKVKLAQIAEAGAGTEWQALQATLARDPRRRADLRIEPYLKDLQNRRTDYTRMLGELASIPPGGRVPPELTQAIQDYQTYTEGIAGSLLTPWYETYRQAGGPEMSDRDLRSLLAYFTHLYGKPPQSAAKPPSSGGVF